MLLIFELFPHCLVRAELKYPCLAGVDSALWLCMIDMVCMVVMPADTYQLMYVHAYRRLQYKYYNELLCHIKKKILILTVQ